MRIIAFLTEPRVIEKILRAGLRRGSQRASSSPRLQIRQAHPKPTEIGLDHASTMGTITLR